MNRLCKALLLTTIPTIALLAFAANRGHTVTFSGWVLDSACAYTKGIDKPVNTACARACAKNGSPMVILRDDGTVFTPISDQTPAVAQNKKLMPYAGERVTVTGTDYARNGSHGLVIEKIAKAAR